MDRADPLPSRGAAGRRLVVRAAKLDDASALVFHDVVAADHVAVAQAHFPTGAQALPALRRIRAEVFLVDPQLTRERHRARPLLADVVREVGSVAPLDLPLGEV